MKDIFIEGPIRSDFIAAKIDAHQDKMEIGGHSIFLGQVRADVVENRKVTAIEYSTYRDLALEKMHVIREETFARHNLICMHVYHSVGKVQTGDICFFVFTSSAHRKAAIEACDELVDRIKSEMPIWGRELFEDESYQWKVNR